MKTKTLVIGQFSAAGYLRMGVGGVLAASGSHLVNPFATGGLFTTTVDGEIQYLVGETWTNMDGNAV